ncbi:MAG: hypothetical protein ACFB0A_13560 [Croceivirga sp.]
MNIFKTTFILLGCVIMANAQSIEGKLTLNGKTKTSLELKSNSAVNLFKEFKTGKYQLKFNFKGKELVKNVYKEEIVFFNFKTVVKRDGKLVKNVIRKQPIPYFPGDMGIPAEAFDFIGLLAVDPEEEEVQMLKEGTIGLMFPGEYSIELYAEPVCTKGKINPVIFSFTVRKNPKLSKY